MESRLGRGLRRAAREEIQLHADPGVARATRLAQAILGHAFSVKRNRRRQQLCDPEVTDRNVCPTHSSTIEFRWPRESRQPEKIKT